MLSAMSVWLPMGLALLLLVIAMRLLFKGGMLAAVMRAMLGLAILAASALSFFTAYDLMSYRPLFEEQAVVTLQFQKLAAQRFRVVLVDSERGSTTIISMVISGNWMHACCAGDWP